MAGKKDATVQGLGRGPGAYEIAGNVLKDEHIKTFNKSVVKLSQSLLKNVTPYTTGKAGLVCTKMPEFMMTHPNANIQNLAKFMQVILNGWCTGVSGITDKTLNTGVGDTSSPGTSVDYVQNVDGHTRSITIKLPYELKKAPIGTFLSLYQSGLGGDDSQDQHYLGNDLLEHGNENHTFEFLYFTYDPGMSYVIHSYKFENCICKTSKESAAEWEKGNVNHVDISLEFTVSARTNNAVIHNACQKILDAWKTGGKVKRASNDLDYKSEMAIINI